MNYNPESTKQVRKCAECSKESSMWPGQKRCLDCSIRVDRERRERARLARKQL